MRALRALGLLDEDPGTAFARLTSSPTFDRMTRVEGRDYPATAPSMIGATKLLRKHLLIYGLGGTVAPFVGIKLIDQLLRSLGWV